MTVAMEQSQLPLSRHANPVSVTVEMVARQSTLLGAINLCVQLSGLDDKEVCTSLDIGPAQWSRILSGDAHFPPNKLGPLMDLCGNEAPLLWLANSRGYGLVLLKTEAERRAEAAEAALAKEREKVEMLRDLLRRNA